MKKLLVITAILLFVAGIAYAKDYELQKKAGVYDVTVTIDKNPPVVGDNNVTVVVKDAAGKNVVDAKVEVDYSMPAMPGMPAMRYKTSAELKDSEYKAKMVLSAAGSWNIWIKIWKAGKLSSMKFTVDAH